MSQFENVEIPYGAYWSTPFAKWQGSLQHLHAGSFAAHVAKAELAKREISASLFDFAVLGQTVVQYQSFNAAPWPLSLMGLDHVAGPLVSQVCATGTRSVQIVAAEIALGMASVGLALCADRISNGPHIYYPAPNGPGGTGQSEDQVMFNMISDPMGKHSMTQTAENVAAKLGISTAEQHDVVVMRGEQYRAALADERAFQKRFMTLPLSVPSANFRKVTGVLEGDEGVRISTPEDLAGLKPVMPGGTVTFAGQTHPADGNAAIILASADKAKDISQDSSIRVKLLGFGQARVELGFMPEAPACATTVALKNAGIELEAVDCVKSHNPFAVNDIAFSRETGFPLKRMNNYGCSLIWGHPQGPTATRAIIELIEELVIRGGGIGLFQGCAAGDTGMAAIISVDSRKA